MNYRAGDILVWRSTVFIDLVLDHIIQMPGLHSGIILKGKQIGELSPIKSPSDTYVTFLDHKILPLEEVISQIWYRPNGSALYIIHRYDGEDITEDLQYSILQKYFKYKPTRRYITIHQLISAYFKLGDIKPGPIYYNQRFNTCANIIGYLLFNFGLLSKRAIINNLLPIDFYNCKFYQRCNYVRIDIFDKKTNQHSWYLLGILINHGFVKNYKKKEHPYVQYLKGDYEYKRDTTYFR